MGVFKCVKEKEQRDVKVLSTLSNERDEEVEEVCTSSSRTKHSEPSSSPLCYNCWVLIRANLGLLRCSWRTDKEAGVRLHLRFYNISNGYQDYVVTCDDSVSGLDQMNNVVKWVDNWTFSLHVKQEKRPMPRPQESAALSKFFFSF